MNPLPPRLSHEKAVKLEVYLLFKRLEVALMTFPYAADLDCLSSTRPFNLEFDDQVDP
jgi:hypothetical protein